MLKTSHLIILKLNFSVHKDQMKYQRPLIEIAVWKITGLPASIKYHFNFFQPFHLIDNLDTSVQEKVNVVVN